MPLSTSRNHFAFLIMPALCGLFAPLVSLRAADSAAKVFVVLWFDTEDYILPASDDAALRLAQSLTREGVRATFKVVGEKARTLERRGRQDVIDALKKHEIGYHSNFHSIPPSPAMYLANLSWEEGVAEFDRRERPGFEDVKRIFGVAPSCYGQPGSSWGPQVYGAMRKWGMEVYLDSGKHVHLENKPFYYGGVLNLYSLTYTLRANLASPTLTEAEEKFLEAKKNLLQEGGGVISIYYHPCEFVHKEFWDGVNFREGANPPRQQWRLPRTKTPEESQAAYKTLDQYIAFIRRFPEVRFITASEARKIYRDQLRTHDVTPEEIKAIAKNVGEEIAFQRRGDYSLAPSEILPLLNEYVVARLQGKEPPFLQVKSTPFGPACPGPVIMGSLKIDGSQINQTALDVADYLRVQGRIPNSIWMGSIPISPEAYLGLLARLTIAFLEGKPLPEAVEVKPMKFNVTSYVPEDGPDLWKWVIFPRGFRAPELMQLARRQAWTLKPAHLAENGSN